MLTLPEPLRAMASYSQFILWEAKWNAAKQKNEKIPINPHTLQPFPKGEDWQDNPSFWTSFNHAQQICMVSPGLKVGFLFTERDPFFFVDIDRAILPDNTWSPIALDLCTVFNGCAVEISQSGTGLHIFGIGTPPVDHRCRDDKIGLEFYSHGRFVALTGTSIIGDSGHRCETGVQFLIEKYLPPRATPGSQDWTTEPVEEWNGPADDDELIKKMLGARSSAAAAFGNKAPLKTLWEGDEEELGKFYPSSTGDAFDRSAADAALCQHLAFWTGKDCERIQRLFERSGLMRDKFASREDYRHDTITKGCAWCNSVYKSPKKDKVVAEYKMESLDVEPGTIREGYQFLGPLQQMDYFKNCVYVAREHAIKIPNGMLMKAEPFRAKYGGYWFAMDSIGDKISKNAWEVFTESQAIRFPRADMTCFRPELPPHTIIDEDGFTRVNTYVPLNTLKIEGDPSPFLRHFEKLLPIERDRRILLSYMAACVQMIGVKFRWCPFIQGVEGNGKSTLSRVVARAVGVRYSHSPAAKDIDNKFNDWMEGKVFIFVEDIYTADRVEVMETLKPLITERWVEVQPKGGAKYMADNRSNFMINSNYKDGVQKKPNDRRIAPFYTAQQSKDDMMRDGMDDKYFEELNDWLDNKNGFEIITHFLSNYKIEDEFNPCKMASAPLTGSTGEAIAAGLGSIEQEILEAVEQGIPGFMGGWISSVAVERLMERRRDSRKVPNNKRKDMLASIGYVQHPNLPDGRTSTMVAIDGGSKPRLYIKKGHLAAHLTTNNQIVDAYTKAQEAGGDNVIAAMVFAAQK